MKKLEEIDLIKHLLSANQIKIIDILKIIDNSAIDENRTKLYQRNNCLIIEIFGIEDINCPFSFDFGLNEKHRQFRFYLNKSAPIIEVEINNSLLHQTIEAIIDFLKSKISEELTFINNKLVKAKYKYYVEIDGKEEILPHVTLRKPFWFWQKRDVTSKEYAPWMIQ